MTPRTPAEPPPPWRPHAFGCHSDLAARCCAPQGAVRAADGDGDLLLDACEQAIAERFAPVIYHSSDETNFPTNVDRVLAASTLYFYDDACGPDLVSPVRASPSQPSLLGWVIDESCGDRARVRSDATRSQRKQRTFFLGDLPDEQRAGSRDTREWTTYVHVYPDAIGGVTVQYWRLYAYNDAVNDHGGDWEGFHVVVDEELRPVAVRLMGHASLEELPFDALEREGTHVRVFSEGGGHATRAAGTGIRARGCEAARCVIDPNDPRTFIRHETWPGGRVTFPNGRRSAAGVLLNVGSRVKPLHGQEFVRYSGLWGSPGFLYGTSGYWGPAFNETGMRGDGFITAWCAGMAGTHLEAECYAKDVSR